MRAVRAALVARADRMRVEAAGRRLGTRRRSAVMAGTGLVTLGALFTGVSNQVLAINFTAANQSYKVYTDRVVGQYAAGYVSGIDTQDGTDRAVAQIGFKKADLNGMCVIAKQNLPAPLGDVSLVMTGGEPVDGTVTNPVNTLITANELYVAANSLAGKGENIAKMSLGKSADTLTMQDITTHRGTPGAFGLEAETMQIADLDADSYGIDLRGSIALPGLKIRVVPGTATKAACAG